MLYHKRIKNLGKFWKTREKLLSRGWPIEPVSTAFDPLVESFAIFKHAPGQPFVVFRSVTNPLDEVAVPTSPWSRVNYSIDFVFH